MVNLFSTEPARIFGLFPRKGIIRAGSDADLVIWNPKPESVISAGTHHMNSDINIYEGMPVKGRAEYVIKGGEVVIENGRLLSGARKGRYLFRTV